MKREPIMQAKTSLLALAAAALLAACGGGSSHEMAGPSAANNEVPASATASPGAYTHFAASLEPSETSDPLDLRKVASPPTSETDLPQAL
jgi:ABC-type glycerol-3-phosphate transport system substrate-binding protein